MADKLDDLKKLLQDDNSKVIEALVGIIDDMDSQIKDLTKRIEGIEDEVDGMSEEIGLISQGMHIEDDDSIVEAVCPYCQKEIEINLANLQEDEDFICPHCNKEITLEWDEDCDCGCGHDDCEDCNGECDEDK